MRKSKEFLLLPKQNAYVKIFIERSKMPDNNTQTTQTPTPAPTAPVVDNVTDAPAPEPTFSMPEPVSPEPVAQAPDTFKAPEEGTPVQLQDNTEVMSEIANKIGESNNILIALSSDPSVDEMACAIGLSLFLDKLGKRATAIYSGATPNALEFLKPEDTFESTADTLQDFVIALNKDKADHLRYKLDGDFVKIYITPYKNRISEEDLDFSYGDFNVDLVIALDVANGIDLDTALREHGRIMHDASVINITTGNPGKLGEIEWSDKTASSVSEMIAKLVYGISNGNKVAIDKEEATAFLTGIVAATNRFSNAATTSETMKLASRLMESGANQQLISKNITPDIENEILSFSTNAPAKAEEDPTELNIGHDEEGTENEVVDAPIPEGNSELLDDLKAAEASLAGTGAETTPETVDAPLRIEDSEAPVKTTPELPTPQFELPTEPVAEPAPAANETLAPEPTISEPSGFVMPEPAPTEPVAEPTPELSTDEAEKVIEPSADFNPNSLNEDAAKYGQMLADAISEDGGAPAIPETPITTTSEAYSNPAVSMAPPVPASPEINGVPEINYMPLPGDEVLPPPPAPPVDFSAPLPTPPTMPEEAPAFDMPAATPVTPAAPTVPETPATPDAFKIPGM